MNYGSYSVDHDVVIMESADELEHSATITLDIDCTALGAKQTWEQPAEGPEFEPRLCYIGSVLFTFQQLETIYGPDIVTSWYYRTVQLAIESGEFT